MPPAKKTAAAVRKAAASFGQLGGKLLERDGDLWGSLHGSGFLGRVQQPS